MSSDELRRAAELLRDRRHESLLIDDMRRHPRGQARVYDEHGKLISGTPCAQAATDERLWDAIADWLDHEAQAHVHTPAGDRAIYDMPGMENSPAGNVARIIGGGA